jgi:hypothetical protein
MLSTNVFRNSYSAAENRLTYNFLCTVDLLTDGQRDLMQFLLDSCGYRVATSPVIEIKPLFAFEEGSNPDGCIKLRCTDGSILSVYLEIKTHRRELDSSQLQAHISYHVSRNANALLLVITPRPSDTKIVEDLNDHRVIFISWQKIADYLGKNRFGASENKIIAQFLEHSQEEGEFMTTELEKEDITLFIEYLKRRPDERLQGAFDRLAAEFAFDKYLPLKEIPYWKDAWGRKGIDLIIEEDSRWFTFGIYYNTSDHGIPFLEDVAELALFVDIAPERRESLANIPEFVDALHKLEALGWENNLTKSRTDNEWRLVYWRKPLSQIQELNSQVLGRVLEDRLKELSAEPAFVKNYIAAPDSQEG